MRRNLIIAALFAPIFIVLGCLMIVFNSLSKALDSITLDFDL